jgi:hypothetical protein
MIPIAQKAATTSSLSFGRIAKPLRGGGGTGTAAAPSPISGGGSANPLARVAGEEGGCVIFLSEFGTEADDVQQLCSSMTVVSLSDF